jgi:type I restriction enzyme S subunit
MEGQEVKEGYKLTEVGVIPEDWEVSKLDELTHSIKSGKSKSTLKFGNYPVFGSTGVIGRNTYFDYEGAKILVARVGANAGTINAVSGKYCVSDNTLIVDLDLPDFIE